MNRTIIPAGLKSLGPVSLAWLQEAGIRSRADLIRLGAVQAYVRIKARQSRASLNLLWALAGAERGLPSNRLGTDARERLVLELDAALGTKLVGAKSSSRKPATALARRKTKRAK